MRLLIATLAVFGSILSVADAAVSDRFLPQWLKQRSRTMEAQFGRQPFERIGWAEDLKTAYQLGAKHNRPVFVFTHDGHINSGRC